MRSLSRFVGWGGVALVMLGIVACFGNASDFGTTVGALGLIAMFIGAFLGVIANMFSKD